MKTYLTLSAIALAAATSLSSGTVLAQAAAPAATPDFVVTGNFGITSDYRFRGLQQTDGDPAFQGGFDLAHSSGLYVGTWGSNVSTWAAGPGTATKLEVDVYGGYKTSIGAVALDIGAISYMYPGSTTGNVDGNGALTGGDYRANTQEAYIGFSYGIATFKTSYTLSKNYFASTSLPTNAGADARGTIYYDLTLAKEVMPKLTASAHAGYTDYKADDVYSSGRMPAAGPVGNTPGKVSYADFSLGLAYDLNGYVFGVKYFFNDLNNGTKTYATSQQGKSLYKDGVAVSLTKAF
jgi:uncharacterized protein (TIGR02001 family)